MPIVRQLKKDSGGGWTTLEPNNAQTRTRVALAACVVAGGVEYMRGNSGMRATRIVSRAGTTTLRMKLRAELCVSFRL